MSMEIYWLSILDNGRGALATLGFLLFGITLLATFGSVIVREEISDKDKAERMSRGLLRTAAAALIAMLLCVAIRGFTPTKRDIIEAYIIIEGQHIVNSENAEKVLIRTDELVDAIITRVEGTPDK